MVAKLILILAGCLLTCCIAGCDTLNVGTTEPPHNWNTIDFTTATFTPSTTWNDREPATLTLDWGTDGQAPYNLVLNMGGGVLEEPYNGTVTSPFTQTFTLIAGGPFSWTATVTDSLGITGTATGNYAVMTGGYYYATIEKVEFIDGVLTVSILQFEGSDVMVNVTSVDGLIVDAYSVLVPEGNGDAVFQWSAVDPFAGGSGNTTITANVEGFWSGDTATATITIDPVDYVLAAGQLAAIPLQPTAGVGDTVTVLVATGDFPAGAAFNYMNGVAVTTGDGGDFVEDTLNVGEPGGAAKDADGVWGDMSPAPATFFLPENFMMRAADVAADSTLDYIGFNITPIGAGEVTGGGYLFNFGMAFNAAGTYTLGFLEFQDVKRTYYSDHAAVEYNWADLSNDYVDVPNSIVVN